MKSILLRENTDGMMRLPPPYSTLEKRTMDPESFSSLNRARRAATLNPAVVRAVLQYFAGRQAEIALVRISAQSYATEARLDQGTLLSCLNANGSIRAAVVAESGEYLPLPALLDEENFDPTPLVLGFLPILRERFEEVDEVLDMLEEDSNRCLPFDEHLLYKLSDAFYRIFTERLLETDDKAGRIDFLPEETVRLGGLRYNEVLCGTPSLLRDNEDAPCQDAPTVSQAKEEFSAFRSGFSWTAEERELIPVFEDGFRVPEETMRMARRFVHSRNERRPMVNFMWRGVTAYGKSTGVEVMAAILDMPLLRVTCHSTMETQDFLSDFVPNTAGDGAGGAPRFRHVESNFVKALARGYVVEVQEISRIKDSGVLVGLNEYDRAGAIIPLVDGSHTRRSPTAAVVYTDNVGYNSCRPLDPSVIRRMALIIDSYDMPREKALARLRLNTGVEDAGVLEKCYEVWDAVLDFCQSKGITDGSVSLSELEMWVMAVKLDGYADFRQNCIECVVAKATSDMEEQEAIISSVVDLYL